jgi:inhibitor of cysteine peptidase
MKHKNIRIWEGKMKSVVFFGIIYMILLPLLALGCNTGAEPKTVEISLNQFATDNNQTVNIELGKDSSLTVKLGSNGTTGYAWADAIISDTGVIKQSNKNYVGPEDTALVGAGGTDVWTFDSLKAGTSTITFKYGRSWEPNGLYTLTINVTVK